MTGPEVQKEGGLAPTLCYNKNPIVTCPDYSTYRSGYCNYIGGS